MNLFADIRTLVLSALDTMVAAGDLPRGLITDNVTAEPPRDATHGDMATNAAMVLAKPAGMKPREIAEKLAVLLADDPRVTSAEVAGPGFINMRLVDGVWLGVVAAALSQPGFWPVRSGCEPQDHGRIRLGQSHRAASCGSYAGRSLRRRAGQPA